MRGGEREGEKKGERERERIFVPRHQFQGAEFTCISDGSPGLAPGRRLFAAAGAK